VISAAEPSEMDKLFSSSRSGGSIKLKTHDYNFALHGSLSPLASRWNLSQELAKSESAGRSGDRAIGRSAGQWIWLPVTALEIQAKRDAGQRNKKKRRPRHLCHLYARVTSQRTIECIESQQISWTRADGPPQSLDSWRFMCTMNGRSGNRNRSRSRQSRSRS